MEREKQEAIIEAVLFTMGESVEISKLAELIEETKGNTKKIVYAMKEKLQQIVEIGVSEISAADDLKKLDEIRVKDI